MSGVRRNRQVSCGWVRGRLAALASGDLAAEERGACRAHLAQCEACLREFTKAQAAIGALRAVGEVAPPSDAMERLLWLLDTLPMPARTPAWRGWVSWSAAAATLVAAVMVVLVLQRGGLAMRAAGEVGAASVAINSAQGPSQAAEQITAPAPAAPGPGFSTPSPRPRSSTRFPGQEVSTPSGFSTSSPGSGSSAAASGREVSGGQPSKRPSAILQAVGPSPAREAAPLARQAKGRQETLRSGKARATQVVSRRQGIAPQRPSAVPSAGPTAVPSLAPRAAAPSMTPRAAARQDQAEVVSEPGRALAEAEAPGKPPPPPAAQKAAAPRATAGVAGAAGPVGSGGGVEGAEAPLFRAAEPGERLRTLGAPAPATGLAKPNVSAVSEPFWHLRVEAPGRLVVGIPAEFGLTIEGRQSLVAVRAGVQDSQGRPLGREVELALVEEGRRVQASLPATMQKPGRQQVAVALEAEEPAVKTRVTMMVDVEPPPSPEVPMASLVLRDVPLREAAAALARRGRVTVEVDDALANLTVDCNFADPIPVETALELLVEQVGGRLEKRPDGVYHIGAGD